MTDNKLPLDEKNKLIELDHLLENYEAALGKFEERIAEYEKKQTPRNPARPRF